MSNSLWSHGLQPSRVLCPWDSPGKNTGVSCHALLQGIFPIQGLNLHLLMWYVKCFFPWDTRSSSILCMILCQIIYLKKKNKALSGFKNFRVLSSLTNKFWDPNSKAQWCIQSCAKIESLSYINSVLSCTVRKPAVDNLNANCDGISHIYLRFEAILLDQCTKKNKLAMELIISDSTSCLSCSQHPTCDLSGKGWLNQMYLLD